MLDPSEVDRIAHLTGVPLMRLVDWKNRSGDPFELKCRPKEGGAFHLELNTPVPTSLDGAVPVVHGDYESRKEEDGTLVYKSLPGNSMGQVLGNDGRPAFGVGFDCTELDAEGRPVFKIYFGSASEWFVKNAYHARWNELRDAKAELEPDAPKMPAPLTDEERASKERGRNPRDRARAEAGRPRGGGGGGGGNGGGGGGRGRRGSRGGRGRGRG
ncbi:MAG TPA: hypothetical protein VM370_01195 [Candidatus Thermoplasmatota archaeon]|nr:hypothetical protein [Candidatus Thermoplasmatota archaeon]